MMVQVTGLVARKTGKESITYYYRHTVPETERARVGRKDVWVSLGTSDRDEALAKLPAAKVEARNKLAAAVVEQPNAIRLSPTIPATASLVTTDIQQLVRSVGDAHYLATTTQEHRSRFELLTAAKADPTAFWRSKLVSLPKTDGMYRILEDEEFQLHDGLAYFAYRRVSDRISWLTTCLSVGEYDPVSNPLAAFLAERNLSEIDLSHRIVLARALLRAEIDALTHILAQDETKFVALTEEMAKRVGKTDEATVHAILATTSAHDAQAGPSLSVAAAGWITEKSASWGPKRKVACNAALALFIEIAGDKPINAYTKGDIRTFKDVLRRLPPRKSTNPHTRQLSAGDAADKAQELGLETMSAANQNKQLTIMFGLFRWLIANYDDITVNPFTDAAIPNNIIARAQRDSFKNTELNAIFAAPVFTGCASECYWKDPGSTILRDTAKYWVPVLGLFTGARLNELCKLRVVDIRHAEGVDYIDVNGESHPDSRIDGRLKTAASTRQIPVHPDLRRMGFLDFVTKRRSAGDERLFPELRPDAHGKLADGFGKHFARFLKSIGIKHDKIDFHSFRHTWVDACRNSRISNEVVYALKGEALKGTLARYGNGKTDLEILADEMQKLTFKDVDLSHLFVD